jgi:microcystin degradation protein MlrC
MKRVAVGQILQESNSLNPVLTSSQDFKAFGLVTGPDVLSRYGNVGELAGFSALPAEMQEPVEWAGVVRAVAWSGGPLEARVLDQLLSMIRVGLRLRTLDGVLMSLHGAQCAQGEPDVAGRILWEVRKAIGPDIPLVTTLDLHANITRRMVQTADVLLGYHTHPHTDHVHCGRRAARALAHLMTSETRPNISAWKMPLVTNDDGRSTDRGVLADLWKQITAAEAPADVLSVSLFQVQPWLDAPELGWTLYQAYYSEQPSLDPEAVSRECWDTRRHTERQYLKPSDVVEWALAMRGRPIVVSEGHDATNSGAPGDSTLLLNQLLRCVIPDGGALTFCVDPGSVAWCFEAGEGASVELAVGGKRDLGCSPLTVHGQVARLGELSYTLTGHGGYNLPITMGRAAVVTSADTTLVLTERTGPGSSPLMYEAMDLDPREFKIVIAKSPEGFRSDYEPFAAGILYCAAPGCATPFLENVGYRRVTRPLYPLDPFSDMAKAEWAGEMATREGAGE